MSLGSVGWLGWPGWFWCGRPWDSRQIDGGQGCSPLKFGRPGWLTPWPAVVLAVGLELSSGSQPAYLHMASLCFLGFSAGGWVLRMFHEKEFKASYALTLEGPPGQFYWWSSMFSVWGRGVHSGQTGWNGTACAFGKLRINHENRCVISYLGLTESNALINPLLGLGGGTKGKSNLGGNQSGLHKEGVS